VIYPVGMLPQHFDLVGDPNEFEDRLAGRVPPAVLAVAAVLESALRAVCDPQEVDVRAKRDRCERVAAFGGNDAARKMGSFTRPSSPGVDTARHGTR